MGRAVIGNGEGRRVHLESPRAQVAGRELLRRYWQSWRAGRSATTISFPVTSAESPRAVRSSTSGACGVSMANTPSRPRLQGARVTAVDIFGPTPEFERKKRERHSRVEFVLGDVTDPRTIQARSAARTCSARVLLPSPEPVRPVDRAQAAAVKPHPAHVDHSRDQRHAERGGLLSEADGQGPCVVGLIAARPAASGRHFPAPFDPDNGYRKLVLGTHAVARASMLDVSGFRVEQEWPEPSPGPIRAGPRRRLLTGCRALWSA